MRQTLPFGIRMSSMNPGLCRSRLESRQEGPNTGNLGFTSLGAQSRMEPKLVGPVWRYMEAALLCSYSGEMNPLGLDHHRD